MCPHLVQQPLPIYRGIILINHLGKKYGPKTMKTSKCTKFMQIDLTTILKRKHTIILYAAACRISDEKKKMKVSPIMQ